MSSIVFEDRQYEWKDLPEMVPNYWRDFFDMTNFEETICKKLEEESKNNTIYPDITRVLRVFSLPPNKIRVIILGQDPYHCGSAVGLCFSVKKGNKLNPSLQNIYKEIENEGYNHLLTASKDGNLEHWFNQGIFLLNSALTVEEGNPSSHSHIWFDFTRKLMKYLNKYDNIVWLLMGKHAITLGNEINNDTHKLIQTSHPSPLSAYKKCGEHPAFFGSNCFQKINRYIKGNPIIW